jgi:hypothetical protein
MFKFLEGRAKDENDKHLINLIKEIYTNQTIRVGKQKICTHRGVL